MRRITKLTLCAAAAVLLPLGAMAQDDGRAVLQGAVDHVTAMSGFTADFELELDFEVDTETENFISDFTVVFRRPSAAFVHMNNRYQEMYFYSSDGTTTRYVPELEQYMVEDTHTVPSELVKSAANQYTLPAAVIFGELTKLDPYNNVLDGDAPIVLMTSEEFNGVMCDVIQFQYADFTVDVWVEQGENALVHRVRPNLEKEIAMIREQGGDVKKMDIDLRVMHWQPNVVDEASLTYTPGDGVEKVARFYRKPPPSPAEELVGQEAPGIELTRLNGESFNLDDYRGKIVLLDFWATWCGPCRIGMPILSKVAKEFEDKDVVLFAVNLQDTEGPIRSFLESSKLQDLKVVLDTDGVTMEPYKANSIPQMVVVGKDGVVKKVHVGVSPNYEEELRKELTELTM